jgi:hypothetical protein
VEVPLCFIDAQPRCSCVDQFGQGIFAVNAINQTGGFSRAIGPTVERDPGAGCLADEP